MIMKKFICIMALIMGVITIGLGIYCSIFPMIYLVLYLLGYGILCGIMIFFISRESFFSWIGVILAFFLLMVSIGISSFLIRTDTLLNRITDVQKEVSSYSVIVLKESSYVDLKDVSGLELGVIEKGDSSYQKALKKVHDMVDVKEKGFENILTLANGLFQHNVEVILLNDSYISILDEGLDGFEDKIRVLKVISIETETEVNEFIKGKKSYQENEGFNVYISGIDTYGSIQTISRSDVNIIATVNPKDSKILLTTIPRDMYVPLFGKEGLRDKLTHAGVYGIDTSIRTLENFLDTDIDYYVRINFNSLISLVDYIGGIDVYSDYNFKAGDRSFQVGMNYNLNGKEALAFSRNRYAFADGDRQRGRNQEKVIEAIIHKVTSSRDINTYLNLVSTLEKSFQTNMSKDMIHQLIQQQLENNYQWNVTSRDVNGYDHFDYTYSYPWQKLYVMLVDENSLRNAQENIKKTLMGN